MKEAIQQTGKTPIGYLYDNFSWALKYTSLFALVLCLALLCHRRGNLNVPTSSRPVTLRAIIIGTFDFLLIVFVFFSDIFYTHKVNDISDNSISLFKQYQDVPVGLERIAGCARSAPPIDYGYQVFFLALAMRIVFIYGRIKLAWLSSFICAYFNEPNCVKKEEKGPGSKGDR